jgi:glutamate-1-semialdehyde 2,1-aminomutase
MEVSQGKLNAYLRQYKARREAETGTRYAASEALHDRAQRVIPPPHTQTFSKGVAQYPRGISPLYIAGGRGSRVWDADGNEYIDFTAALGPITLGYQYPAVDDAVREQMESGVIFGLPHKLEVEVSELICEMVPCAEMVRFGKNGSDATTGAIRLARAYTGRDHIAQCGYHGWHDWSIGVSGRNKGVPQAVRDLTHPFRYNDLPSLERIFERYPNQVACVIMEPANSVLPDKGFLEGVRDLAHRNGALFILDEVITGFRYANGGAQEYFGVVPDLATFGKGIANGYPLSAIVGRADIMRVLGDVHYSFTNGGECLSLAAAKAALTVLKTEPVCNHLWKMGDYLRKGIAQIVQQMEWDYNREHILDGLKFDWGVDISGHPSWTFLTFRNEAQKTLWKQEIFARGILSLGQHFISYSHTAEDIDRLLAVYREVFPILAKYQGREEEVLRVKVQEPLFTVR